MLTLQRERRQRPAATTCPELSMPSFERVTEESIRRLVDAFYEKVRRDPELGPVFDAAIAAEGWPAHLAKMYDFWSSVMLTTGRYKGNPMAVHMAVDGIAAPLFARWLELFGATAEELFAPPLAAAFRVKAERIAESLMLGLFYRPGARTDGLVIRRQAPAGEG
jgi:hemoglobin